MNRDWNELCNQAFTDNKFLCVGIDPIFDPHWEIASDDVKDDIMQELEEFCIAKVKAVGKIAGFLKPNWAFFVQYGWRGLRVLERVLTYINRYFPNVVVILDMKVGDIGDTNLAYARAAFDELGGDAITIHPYLGKTANQPFLDYTKKGIIVLCHTSNKGAEEFQHLPIGENDPLFLKVAENVALRWNKYYNCALVTGATYPEAIEKVRQTARQLPLLIPGIGKQGGDLKAAVAAARGNDDGKFIVNASTSVFHAKNSGIAAQEHHEAILAARH